MRTGTALLMLATSLLGGCALLPLPQHPASAEPISAGQQTSTSPADLSRLSARQNPASPSDFSKSEFIADDFLSAIVRIPTFVPGETLFSATLPRTRYGEILMSRLRDAGFGIVLGPNPALPQLSYDVELPRGQGDDLHTFYVSLGDVHLKRSYEIVIDRIAPVTEMLIAGVDIGSLRPMSLATSGSLSSTVPPTAAMDVPSLRARIAGDSTWDPLEPNMYESRESVYDPLFAHADVEYQKLSSQVLVFPNDSLVLGEQNKQYLRNLATDFQAESDVVRVIGCSHGRTQIDDGNQKLARGRAARVREELLLAGVNSHAILHEACWANVHFDEMMPRRGVVIMHLRGRT